MRSILVLFALSLTAMTFEPARAADATTSWTGPYVGLSGGYDWAEAPIRLTPQGKWLSDSEAPIVSQSGSPTFRPGGFIGGGLVGYQQQIGAIVVGAEGDFSWTSLDAFAQTNRYTAPITGDTYVFQSGVSADWLATLRGRVGLAVADGVLPYVTGGLSLADFRYRNGYIFGLGPGLGGHLVPQISEAEQSRTAVGWSAGAGLDYLLDQRWSFRAEYLHTDLGTGATFETAEFINGVATNNGYTSRHNATLTEDVLRFGIIYRFNLF
jgi:outer membrane immunogenic protein